ncbi:MJ0042 family finger-like domain-containing protein [Roseateles sp. YR242]|uniref:zinc-ribbon and DUF3426 domain-containing protein n=1 Tax=Roseateles sp. YR242 TaxID=1855305 RepID=UPI0008BB391E|nr:zinc-ribbon and DUF3426 domain-containing protein [Roseateles sp. YR242]SEK60332.1 MJ0042 family finger-like domain-containing protein [Roseateles sp. YR242]
MNLATRCTTCGTIFRVVQDQLRVSEGWVRCGRCAEVFDAREQLFDLEQDSPPPWPPQAAAEPPPSRPAPLKQAPVPTPPAAPPHQAQTLAAAAARQPVAPPAPMYAAEPPPVPREPVEAPPSFPTQSMAAAFDDIPRRFAPPPVEARDSDWLANDDNELNPFAPPRHLQEEDLHEEELQPSPRQYSRPRHRPAPPPSRPHSSTYSESSYDEERLEPFLAPPTPPDSPSHLPEPRGMRFEEDELPPPVPDDERPDVLLALSPATAAQLKSQEPALDPHIPVRRTTDEGEPSMMPSSDEGAPLSKAERKAAEKAQAKRAAEAAKQAKLDEKAAEKAAREAEKEAERAAKEAEKLAKETQKAAEKAAKAEARIKGQQAAAAAPTVPSFVRKAESAQRWHRPWVRAALGAVALMLLAGLGGQGVWHAREAIAAQYPFAKPMLAQVTTAMGQELKPWRHIEALSVESSSLNPAGEGNHYRLTLSLRNRSNWEVAQPWVDLSLTDAAGQLVVRRMLSPEELHASQAAMASGADQQLQVVFDSGTTKISGYTVELFYP